MKSSIKKEVRTPKYKMRVVQSEKGKGSYSRSKVKFTLKIINFKN